MAEEAEAGPEPGAPALTIRKKVGGRSKSGHGPRMVTALRQAPSPSSATTLVESGWGHYGRDGPGQGSRTYASEPIGFQRRPPGA